MAAGDYTPRLVFSNQFSVPYYPYHPRDLAAKFSQDHPRRHQLQRLSLRLRSEALTSLATQISQMRQPNSLTSIKPIQTQYALASTLILYNVELLGAQSGQWQVHLQGARTILQWKRTIPSRAQLYQMKSIHSSYTKQYFASVFAGLTSFDTTHPTRLKKSSSTSTTQPFSAILSTS